MSMSTDKILEAALSRSPEARAFVAERLLESLDTAAGAELSPAWRDEIQRRSHEVDAGIVELKDAAEVFERAFQSLE